MIQYIALLSAVTEDTRPLSEKMGEAGINTVIAISIVFFALAFISVIIAIEGKIFTKINNKAAKKVVEAPTPAAGPETVEESADDEELVAVITAAIYEYEMQTTGAVPVGGLRVRSIRRRL